MPAVSMIRQRLGNKTFTSYVPATAEAAKSFAEALLPGEYEILEKIGENGNDNVTDGYKIFTVMIESDETHDKTYLTFVSKIGKTSDDVIAGLKGKTFNGVKADKVVVINSRKVTLATSDSGDSGGEG